MIPREDRYSSRRGIIAVRDDLAVRMVEKWSGIGAIPISGDEIARQRHIRRTS